MKGWLPLGVSLVLGVSACASMKSTPQQDYVWEMGRNCENKFTDLRMERVDSTGRYWVRGNNATSAAPYFDCMKDQFNAHPFPDWLKAQKPETH